jgi:hypothetical protein
VPRSCGATWPGLESGADPRDVLGLLHPEVIVMERMRGIPISQVAPLREAGVDIPKLRARRGHLFFTQVFRDGFFHADMHPGNIQVSIEPNTFGRYISLDFGIVGTLTESTRNTWRKISLLFSGATTSGLPNCISSRAGCPRHPGGRTGGGRACGV